MFTQIQNRLLLKHPLLWNLKLIPMLALTVGINLLFFIIGLVDGSIDFQSEDNWNRENVFIIVFLAIATAALVTIIWLVYYFRNNAFKSFYTKRNGSLYNEWALLLLICFLNCSYSASYFLAKDIRARAYFSEAEFARRADIITMSSIFVLGSFEDSGSYVEKTPSGPVARTRDYMVYDGKQYPLNSLLNKATDEFTYNSDKKDSLTELRVKNWLVENRKDSVLWLMREFDKIAKEHGLRGNITPQQWLSLVYEYPNFAPAITIGNKEILNKYNYNNYNNYYEEEVVAPVAVSDLANDTLSNTIKIIDGETRVYPKYYVPFEQLKSSYSKVSSAYTAPDLNADSMLVYLYFALGLSILIFSFRVTSGRSWLIAAISLGLISLLSGIFTIAVSSGIAYLVFWLMVTLGVAVYHLNALHNRVKDNSAVSLNALLWLLPWTLPLIYGLVAAIAQDNRHYNMPRTPFEQWMDENYPIMFYVNLILVAVYMYFFAVSIKRWKGLPEA